MDTLCFSGAEHPSASNCADLAPSAHDQVTDLLTSEAGKTPSALPALWRETCDARFPMASDPAVGSLLRTLAASKPGGQFLEIGSGTGLSTAWLLDGMSADAHLLTIDNDACAMTMLQRHLGHDRRLQMQVMDGDACLKTLRPASYDFIFADAWPGKYRLLHLTLGLLKPGGLYVVDDMLPQPNWPVGHAAKARDLAHTLATTPGFYATHLAWATGVTIVTRQS